MKIGKAVKYLRERKRMTQEELAHRAGASQSTISNLEMGAVDYSASLIEGLAVALGVRPSEIFAAAEELLGMPPPSVPSTNEEQKLLENFRAMEPTAKYGFATIGDSLAKPTADKKSKGGFTQ